jgi:hypothetical protein
MAIISITANIAGTGALTAANFLTKGLSTSLRGEASLLALATVIPSVLPPLPPLADVHLPPLGEYVMENGSHIHALTVLPPYARLGAVLRDALGARWQIESIHWQSGAYRLALRPLAPTPYRFRPRGNLILEQ